MMNTVRSLEDLIARLGKLQKAAMVAGNELPERQEFYQGKASAFQQIIDLIKED